MSLRELLPGMNPRDHALLTAVLAICFLPPIPLPGISTVCGCVIVIAGVRMTWGLPPWIPRRWRERPLPGRSLVRVFWSMAAVMLKLEVMIRPRGRLISAHPWTLKANGLAIALCGLLIGGPLPPGSNPPPAFALLLLSIGTLEEDLLFLGLGYGALAGTLVLFARLGAMGWSGLRALLA